MDLYSKRCAAIILLFTAPTQSLWLGKRTARA